MKGLKGKRKEDLPQFWKDYEASFPGNHFPDLSQNTFVVLDTETTGFSFQKDRILSIGALRLEGGAIEVRNTLELYLEQERFDRTSVVVHGLLRSGPGVRIPELDALRQFLDYAKSYIIVGHHTLFDITMINKALKRHGLPKLLNKTLDTAILYPKTLLRTPLRLKKERYTLDELADAFDIELKDRHTALGDAYITAIAFLKIVNRLQKKGRTDLDALLKLKAAN